MIVEFMRPFGSHEILTEIISNALAGNGGRAWHGRNEHRILMVHLI